MTAALLVACGDDDSGSQTDTTVAPIDTSVLDDVGVSFSDGCACVAPDDCPRVDPLDRQAVARLYHAVWTAAEDANASWTGDHATCDPGAVSADYHDATLLRVAFARILAGLEAVPGDAEQGAKAQAAALAFSANSAISGEPPDDWNCTSADAAEAASRSLRILARSGPDAIRSSLDGELSSAELPTRRWLLFPRLTKIGVGTVPETGPHPAATALWVGDNVAPQTERFEIGWPTAGYFPRPLVPTSGRWSVSATGADFSGASVTVTVDGQPVSVEVVHRDGSQGDPTLVFTGDDLPSPTDPDRQDLDVAIVVTGVIFGSSSRDIAYTVTLFDPSSVPACN